MRPNLSCYTKADAPHIAYLAKKRKAFVVEARHLKQIEKHLEDVLSGEVTDRKQEVMEVMGVDEGEGRIESWMQRGGMWQWECRGGRCERGEGTRNGLQY